MENTRYLELAEKWLNGTITPEEEKEYADWFNSIEPDESLHIPPDLAKTPAEHRNKILQQINRKRRHVINIKRRRFYWAAAAVLMIFCGGLYWLTDKPSAKSDSASAAGSSKTSNDIQPGTSGAVLRLANGETIVLDTAANGRLVSDVKAEIVKSDGSVAFVAASGKKAAVAEFNTLTTPRGRQQQLVLSDGTKVWLNAQSSIKFPTAFTGQQREVIITGEAYFEVTKNLVKPFVVHVNEASVEVLGTNFNVMAYSNEPALETTLLEGAVKFKAGNGSILLKPGQQSRLSGSTNLKLVENADVEQAVAWKNGMQSFNKADIKTIMRQVERWYDVDVAFSGNVRSRTFSGEIPRDAKLSELLKLFQATNIHFSIDAEKRKLTVMP